MNRDWSFDPVFPFQIRRFNCAGQYMQKCSWYTVLYLTRGRIIVKQTTGFLFLDPVCSLIIPAGQGPNLRFGADCAGFELLIDNTLLTEVTARLTEKGYLYLPDNDVSVFFIKAGEDTVFELSLNQLLTEWDERKPGFRDIIRLKLAEFFIKLGRLEQTQKEYLCEADKQALPVDVKHESKKIDEILVYLEQHYTRPLSLAELASASGFSASYLSRFFRKKTGVCLFEYINKLRIKQACLLLKKTNKRIIEIAYDVGYNNISFFNRYFKKILRLSPQAYRRKVQQ